MTFYRKDPEAFCNYINQLLGKGHRDSSFCDLDSCAWRVPYVSHDGINNGNGHRFLILEIKQANEDFLWAHEWALRSLATLPGVDVWFVRVLEDGNFFVADLGNAGWPFFDRAVMTPKAFHNRWHAWWNWESVDAIATVGRGLAWAEFAQTNEGLRNYMSAEVARGNLELHTLRLEYKHAQDIIRSLQREILQLKQKRAANVGETIEWKDS